MLPLDDLVEIAGLSDAQLDGEEMRQGAVEWWGIPEWTLLSNRNFRPHIRFLAEFTPEQRQAMLTAEGLPFGKMTLAQQQRFLSFAIKGDPLRSFDELASGVASGNISRAKALKKSGYAKEWRGDWREQWLIVGCGVVYTSVILLVFG